MAINISGKVKQFNLGAGKVKPLSYSVHFDGAGDYIDVASSADFAMGTGDFTVEGWIYADQTPSDDSIWDSRSNGTNTVNGFTITAFSTSVIRVWTDGEVVSATGLSYVNKWTHVAVVRVSGTIHLYIDGVDKGSASEPVDMTHTQPIIGAGRYTASTAVTSFFPGYISNFRVVKGDAVYTSNFTPSTHPLNEITNTKLLACARKTIVDASSAGHTLTAQGNAIEDTKHPF